MVTGWVYTLSKARDQKTHNSLVVHFENFSITNVVVCLGQGNRAYSDVDKGVIQWCFFQISPCQYKIIAELMCVSMFF